MPLIDVRGVSVNFPFTPYKCQEDYMSKVMECLQKEVNGILESPTGTGKTLCLLCSTLAWREHFKDSISARKIAERMDGVEMFPKRPMASWGKADKEGDAPAYYTDVPKIIYASRTHSQLTQVISELKNTSYRPKVCVLGSREQLCIHPEVMKQESNHVKVHMCRAKMTSRSCLYYNNVEEKSTDKELTNTILDVEDLVKNGNKHRVCPYYLSRSLKQQAEIIFMPYNYLLDPKSRKAHNIELKGTVVIFDEAHNVEKMCEESASSDLTPYDLATAIDAVNQVLTLQASTAEKSGLSEDFNIETTNPGLKMDVADIAKIKRILLDLEAAIDSIELPSNGAGLTKPGSYIFELFKQAQLTFETKTAVLDALEQIMGYFAERNSVFTNTSGLQKLSDIIQIVFSRDPPEGMSSFAAEQSIAKHYKVHIHSDTNIHKKKQRTDPWSSTTSTKQGKILSYWCFSPGYTMHELVSQGVRSIILTSGTLSPLSSFTAEMQISFPVLLENPHVIDKHQIFVGIIPKGPDGVQLSSAFDKRFSPDYMASLGNTVVNIGRVVPHGLLVFFPSYTVMDKTIEFWRENGCTNRIEDVKPMFIEPKGKGSFNEVINGYYTKVNDSSISGASFFAVCRGKASEGLDFSDTNGRGVLITGLPFPPRMDPRVILKMQFLDEVGKRANGIKCLTGQEWYRQQASRAVNQAIGRVIRHRQDFGGIFLCDHRFMSTDARSQLPLWVRPYVKVYDNFGHVIRDSSQFFRKVQKIMPPPKVKLDNSCKDICSEQCNSKPYSSNAISSQLSNSFMRKAKTLDSHVPSLKKRRIGTSSSYDGTAQLCVEYEGEIQSERKKPLGLLEALDHNERKAFGEEDEMLVGEEKASRLSTLSLQHDKRHDDEQRGNKKRIKLVNSLKNEPLPDSTLNKAEKAKFYLASVKQTLSQANYHQFTQSMQTYKKTDDFDTMLAELSSLCTGDPLKQFLLRDFYQFVRPHHKQRFDEACRSLYGLECGFKPEHALSNLEKGSLMLNATKEKNESGACALSATQNSTKNTSSQLDASQLNKGGCHLNSGVLHKEPLKRGDLLSKDKSEHQSNRLKDYLDKVKEALGPQKYQQFFVSLQTYKKTDNYDNMVLEIVSLLTEGTSDFALLHSFTVFVRPHHKQQYNQMLKELMGMPVEDTLHQAKALTSK
ncbi:regulator of telomere elongation helicase 1 isoform X2 [Polypterus senegalus]|uniref:regulator of telomere elongation helicase 1 isoform X2 n=1 Tax=Polypterus senegalus TaxID=55291 RepID=UPI0019633B3B|nr:regulator of telomere elongation helicase 1 isoform X2 [Polypterus senegalus]